MIKLTAHLSIKEFNFRAETEASRLGLTYDANKLLLSPLISDPSLLFSHFLNIYCHNRITAHTKINQESFPLLLILASLSRIKMVPGIIGEKILTKKCVIKRRNY